MSVSLEDLLVDPTTHEPVKRATEAQLEKIRAAVAEGRAKRPDGEPVPQPIEGAYLSHGGRWIYVDVDGIPSFLAEARLELDDPL